MVVINSVEQVFGNQESSYETRMFFSSDAEHVAENLRSWTSANFQHRSGFSSFCCHDRRLSILAGKWRNSGHGTFASEYPPTSASDGAVAVFWHKQRPRQRIKQTLVQMQALMSCLFCVVLYNTVSRDLVYETCLCLCTVCTQTLAEGVQQGGRGDLWRSVQSTDTPPIHLRSVNNTATQIPSWLGWTCDIW